MSAQMTFQERFDQFASTELKLKKDDRILLAISGGMDSMCMWHLFRASPYSIDICHCNFKLRAAEADADEEFIRNSIIDNETGHFKDFQVEAYRKEKHLSVQMAARELRYTYFNDLIEKHKYKYVAVAHHLDDQVETFFVQLIRGSRKSALKGMSPVTDQLIRPMMFAYRSEIKAYVEEQGIKYRTDSSNLSHKYLRNKVRHQVLPALSKHYGDFRKDVLSIMNNLNEIERINQDNFETQFETVATHEGESWILSKSKILALPDPNAFVKRLLDRFTFNSKMSDQLLLSMRGHSGKHFFGKEFIMLLDRAELIVEPIPDGISKTIEVGKNELAVFHNLPFEFEFKEIDFPPEFPGDSLIQYLDLDKMGDSITFRKWRDGDVFVPLGMNHKKKLSDFFIDEKMSLKEKRELWLMCDEDQICCILGKRIDERFKIDGNSARMLEIRIL